MTPNQDLVSFPVFANSGTKISPDQAKYAAGFQESDVLPAEWLNYFLNKASAAATALNTLGDSAQKELNNLLTQAGISPDAASTTQVYAAIRSFIQNTANLVVATTAANTAPAGTDNGVVAALESKLKVTVLLKNGYYADSESTKMTFNYKGLGAKKVYVTKDGDVEEIGSSYLDLGTGSKYWYCQPYTKFELEYDATLNNNAGGWLVINNPEVITNNTVGYVIYANGQKVYTKSQIDTMMASLANQLTPVGYVYHQLPGTPSPLEMHLYGTWEELKMGGVFLRAEGDNSLPFTGNFSCNVSGTTILLNSQDQDTMDYETALANETATNLIVIAGGECRAVTAWNRGTHTITIDSAFSATNITNVLIGNNAGLPNVTGKLNSVDRGYYSITGYEGAYSPERLPNSYCAAPGGAKGTDVPQFNAARGETKTDGTLKSASDYKVFGKSDTVMVQHVSSRYWRRTS